MYLYSPNDGKCVEGPDFKAHGSVYFSVWLMQKMAEYKAKNNVKVCGREEGKEGGEVAKRCQGG